MRRYMCTSLALMLAIAGTSYAQELVQRDRQLIEDVLRVSGVAETIESFTAQLRPLAAEHRRELNPLEVMKLDRALSEAFDTDAFQGSMIQTFLRGYDADKLQQIHQWFERPEIQLIVEAHRKASRPEAKDQRDQFERQLEQQPARSERLMLIDRLNTAVDEQATARALLMSARGVGRIVLLARGIEDAVSAEYFAEWEKKKLETMDHLVQLYALFAYRDISDADMQVYVEFYESDLGRWFSRLVNQAFAEAVDGGYERGIKLLKAQGR